MKVQLKVENIFIIIALVFGLIYSIITPPFQSVDENYHFYRSYAITEGQIIATKQNNHTGSYLPKSISELDQKFSYLIKDITKKTSFKEIVQANKIAINKDKVFTSYSNTALYSPIAYIPQSIGIVTGKILHANPLIMLYISRIFNLILYCILGYYAIKYIPFLKTATFLILLSPMNISLAASCSTDVTLIGTSILFAAKIFQYSFSKDKILNFKDYILLSILIFILTLTKHSFYLIPLIFLVPKEKFKKNYYLKIITLILPSIIGCFIWSKIIEELYVPLNQNSNLYEQLNYILNNPLKYICILTTTTLIKAFRLFITSIGVLGWQDTKMDNLTYILYPFLILITLIYSGIKTFVLKHYQKCIIITVIIISYIFISTYIYLTWTKVGNPIIIGLNGKYYTPLLIPLFAVIATSLKDKKEESKKVINIISISITLILLSGAISIITRFYDIFPNLYYQI